MYKILITEEKEEYSKIIRQMLPSDTYEIFSSDTTYKTMDMLSNFAFNLIIFDLTANNISSKDILNFLKTAPNLKNIPTLAISDTEEHEFDCLIQKPVNYTELIKAIKDNIKKQKITNILVVDDNPMNAELMKEACEQIGCSVNCLDKGTDVLPALEEKDYDLILLDIMMPGMSGYDVIKLIKSNKHLCHIPIIFVSALNTTKNIVKGLDSGSYDYITKPFNIDELQAKVRNTIRTKELQDKLREKNNLLEKIYTYSTDAIIAVDLDFRIKSCSDIFCKWLGKEEEFLKDKILWDIIKNPLSPHHQYLDEIPSSDIELKEKFMTLSMKGAAFKNSKDETEGYIIVLRDVTKEREMEKQKETFIATLTHDLKTPVRAEIRAMELLLDNKFGEISHEQRELISEILRSSNYMFSMIDSLLTKYKYENGEISLKKEPINLNELIKTCCNELKIIADEKNQIISTLFEEAPIIAEVDPSEYKRVISNITINAIKSSPHNSTITIKTSLDKDNFAKIQIIDTGVGISEEKLPYIFDKYVSYNDKFRAVGTGLGLYISKKIAELHGGKIEVQSKEGDGTTFTLYTPVTAKIPI